MDLPSVPGMTGETYARARWGRRGLLKAGIIGGSLSVLPACDNFAPEWTPEVTFDRPLWLPPVAQSTVGADGVRVFSLRPQQGSTLFAGTRKTDTWGFDGDYLGPTLRARVGERVRVDVTNGLDQTTTVHWHGMHLPARMDGGPHQPIEPGDTWSPEWEIRQAPATLWYHPHPHGATEEHVYRGLAGCFLIDPAAGEDDHLPQEYGVDDFTLIVQDKKITKDGELIFDDGGNEIGLLGTLFLVNGTSGATQQITTSLARLRILNGSTARTYDLGFSDDRSYQLVGTDGGLLASATTMKRVRVSPGERVEIVVGFEPGETVRLTSYGARLGDVVVPSVFGAEDVADLVEFRCRPTLHPRAAVPNDLTTLEPLAESRVTVKREFTFEGREINGQKMDMNRVDLAVTLGSTEIWSVFSKNSFPHNFHCHDVQFRVLDIDGTEPPPELAGRKDTIYLEPRRTYRLLMTFEDFADPVYPYMYHCHLLLHEDDGMMGQFLVLEPGDEPALVDSGDHEH